MFNRAGAIILLSVMLVAASEAAVSQTKKRDINDVDSIPYIGNKCKNIYRNKFLAKEMHRAFFIAKNGACGASFQFRSRAKAEYQALLHCKPHAKGNECRVYAVNNSVVWKSE